MNQPLQWNVIRALNVAHMGFYLNDIGGFQKHKDIINSTFHWGIKHNRFCFRYLFFVTSIFLFQKTMT